MLHRNDSLTALEKDMDIFLTAPILQLHCVKVKVLPCEGLLVQMGHNYVYQTDRESCSDPEAIRLTKYISDTIGRLEVCSGGYWGSVCGIGATDAIAKVACRQLNHAATGIYRYYIVL